MLVFSDLTGNTPPRRSPLGDDVSIDSTRVPGARVTSVAAVTSEPTRTKQPISPPPNTSITVSPQQRFPRVPDVPPLIKPTTNLPLVPGQLVTSPTIPTTATDRPSLDIRPPAPAVAPQLPQSVTAPPAPAKSKAWMWILGGVVAAAGVGVTVYAVTRPARPRRPRRRAA